METSQKYKELHPDWQAQIVALITLGEIKRIHSSLCDFIQDQWGELTIIQRVNIQKDILRWQKIIDYQDYRLIHVPEWFRNKEIIPPEEIKNSFHYVYY